MTDEPTLGEVLRRLDDYIAQQQRIVDRLERMASDNAATFVRQDVYLANRMADQSVVADLHGDIRTVKNDRQKDIEAMDSDRKADTAWRRQRDLTLAVTTITSLVAIAVAVATFVSR